MSLLKFLSREKLVEYLDEELRLFLNARGIYEINQYGWLADNRPDPDYLGLAMWQTEPPGKGHESPDLAEIPENPASRQTRIGRITQNGREFEHLIKSARHSIGLSHLYHRNPDELSPCFGFHFLETAIKLTMAGDRLRDFFIDACAALPGFSRKTRIPDPPSGPARLPLSYCRPFARARDILADNSAQNQNLFDCLAELSALTERIYFYRDLHHSGLNDPGDIETLADWYTLTIDTANQIFLAEYLLRNFAQTPQLGHIAEFR
ncbi:MAG: hypothetical protein RQ753_03965 [Desulfurivibrionaceae bacterium]|nr:hypothetical protein [Desulfobulbales bacterium]MDT8334832.1 hypothetical protein [Desulfurivibrionaceae bacterium]